MVSSFVKNEHLREALSFHSLLVGGNPMTTSAIYALIHKLEKDGGVWFAKGGTHALVRGMVTHFERLGGSIRLGDAVTEIETLGDRVTGSGRHSGWRGDFDAVASNADCDAQLSRLAGPSMRGRKAAGGTGAQALLAFAVRRPFRHQGALAGHPAPHHPVRAALSGAVTDIYDHGVLPADFLALSAPPDRERSRSRARGPFDLLCARPGTASRQAAGRLGRNRRRPMRTASLAEIERRLIPELRERNRDALPLCAERFRDRSERASGSAVQPGADPDSIGLVPRP
jgi:phytoene desaturase